jgi:hypothetical protein
LENCYKKVKNANLKFETVTIFRLNGICVGYPLYDISYALKYIRHKLKKGGFKVSKINDNSIVIDWSLRT